MLEKAAVVAVAMLVGASGIPGMAESNEETCNACQETSVQTIGNSDALPTSMFPYRNIALSNICKNSQKTGGGLELNGGDMDASFFDVQEIIELGQTAWGLTSADFNGDGNIDVAVSSATCPFSRAAISIFYNNGNGTFTRDDVFTFSYSYINDLDSGDFDNDGDIDLMFTYSEYVWYQGWPVKVNGTVNLLFNDGNNQFSNLTMVAWHGPGIPFDPENRINPQLTSADYDRDGDIDFMVGDNSGKVEFYVNDGDGNFTSAGIIHDFGHASWGLTSTDYDRDGDIDFLVAAETEEGSNYGHVYVKENQVDSNVSTCFESGSGKIILDISNVPGSASLTSLDYNGDGHVDIIAGIFNQIYLVVNKHGIYDPFFICRLPDNPEGYSDNMNLGGLTSGDYNRDGHEDFIAGGVQGVVRQFIHNLTLATIDRPRERYWYLFDEEKYPIFEEDGILAIGKITVEVRVLEELEKIEFYVDDALKYSDDEAPYEWLWRQMSLGKHTLKIVPYDTEGAYGGTDTLILWKFF